MGTIQLDHGLGVQSYCFREFKQNQEVIRCVKELKLKAIELCRVHVNFDDPAVVEPTIATYKEAGIQIVSIGIETLSGNQEKDESKFKFAKAAGARFIGVNFQLDNLHTALKTSEELAEKYDLYLAIHNHGARHWLGNTQALDYVFRQTGPRIGLCMDTAWAIHSHENPIEWVKKFGNRLYGIHFKDLVFEPSGAIRETITGQGNLSLPHLYEALQQVNFRGYGVIEYEGDAQNPLPALKECVANVKSALNL